MNYTDPDQNFRAKFQKELGERIREVRKRDELTQEAFGAEIDELCSSPKTKVSEWETGKRMPDAVDLFVMAKKYKVSLDWLLGLVNNDPGLDDNKPNFMLPSMTTNEVNLESDVLADESKTNGEVWLISPDLGNDIGEGSAVEVVQANIRRGIKYIYICPNLPITRSRRFDLKEKTFKGYPQNYEIYLCPEKEFDTFPLRHILFLNPFRIGGQDPIVFTELHTDKDQWVRASKNDTDRLIGQFEKIIEELRSRQEI